MDSLENDKAIVIKKLNQDDILEIIIEHFWENEGEFKNILNSKAAFFGTPDKDLRVVCIFGDLEDSRIDRWDMCQLDNETEFNGDHSWITRDQIS